MKTALTVLTTLLLIILLVLVFSALSPGLERPAKPAAVSPDGGRADRLLYSPDYANDHTVLAFSANGVFISKDAAGSWSKMTVGPDSETVEEAAFSPAYAWDGTIFALTNKTLYRSLDKAYTWRRMKTFKSGNSELIAISPDYAKDGTVFVNHGKLFRSVDRGRAFRAVADMRLPRFVTDFVFSPDYADDKTIIMAVEEDGIYRSLDKGRTWELRLSDFFPEIGLLAFSPDFKTDRKIFVAPTGGGSDDKLMISSDAGDHWSEKLPGIFRALAFSPYYSKDKTVFVAGDAGLFVSKTGGRRWHLASPTDMNGEFEASYIESLVISPAYPDDRRVFAVKAWEAKSSSLYYLTNNGRTWSRPVLKYREVNQIAPTPTFKTDETILAATADGIFKSTDGGRSWKSSDRGFSAVTIGAAAVSPDFAVDKVMFIAGERGVYKSSAAGASWKKVKNESHGYDLAIAVSPDYLRDGTVFVSGFQGGVIRSIDGGESWKKFGYESETFSGVALSPDYARDHLIFGQDNESFSLKRSIDSGASWREVYLKVDGTGIVPQKIVFSPTFALDKTVFAVDINAAFKSTDKGLNWRVIKRRRISGFGMPGPGDGVRQLFVSPDYAHDKTVIVVTDGRAYISHTGGDRWKRLKGGSQLFAFSPDYAADHQIFNISVRDSGEAGVFRTADDGRNWAKVSDLDFSFAKTMSIVTEDGKKIVFVSSFQAGLSNFELRD